ncbi:DUF6484 domain-containing protein [Pyxidicoccus xibeiensis]|uniref:DUF6484 domain-containing protein n=1 Tax=Pyxidicoccus xibeiensis TaxID=2906759 RepID=UPI0020A805B5|nr:DUF6484 domain-containing protein [Pyxidicoccus xibeiensis]MCP3143951.1 DUF6484 domain-containing protein [Pyxidicoccus xibeiensis]
MSGQKPGAEQRGTAAPDLIHGHKVGWVAGRASEGALLVDFRGNSGGLLPARSTVSLDSRAMDAAVAARQSVVLLFDEGNPQRPIIVGLIQEPSPSPLTDALLDVPARPEAREVSLDGQRVVLEGREEVVLRCGDSSITLRSDGQVLIRGLRVETRAMGTNRIKGGNVQIN